MQNFNSLALAVPKVEGGSQNLKLGPLPLSVGDQDPLLTLCSMGPRSVHHKQHLDLFSQTSRDEPHDRETDTLTWRTSVRIDRLMHSMQPKNWTVTVVLTAFDCFYLHTPAMLWAGIVSGGVCLSVCTTSQKLLIRNWCKLAGIYCMVNTMPVTHVQVNLYNKLVQKTCISSDWKFVTFDLESYFRMFSFTIHISSTVTSFKYLNLATACLAWKHIFRISKSPSSFKVIGLISKSKQWKNSHVQICAPLGHSLIAACSLQQQKWINI